MKNALIGLGIAGVVALGGTVIDSTTASLSDIQKETIQDYQSLNSALPFVFDGEDTKSLDAYITQTVLSGQNPVITAPSLTDISDAYLRVLNNVGGKVEPGKEVVAAQAIRKQAKEIGLTVKPLEEI